MKISDAILYNDNQVIAFNKQPGQLVQAGKDDSLPLVALARMYCKHPVHVVHRLDRPASGVVLFAKNQKALVKLNQQWRERQVKKTYLAAVANKPSKDKGTLTHHIEKLPGKSMSRIVPKPTEFSKEAILHYTYLLSIEHYHLLEIDLVTGRYHQIRAQLAHIGCPIRGDDKYGFKRGNPDRSIQLHSWKLNFNHPVSEESIRIRASLPDNPVWDAFKKEKEEIFS